MDTYPPETTKVRPSIFILRYHLFIDSKSSIVRGEVDVQRLESGILTLKEVERSHHGSHGDCGG